MPENVEASVRELCALRADLGDWEKVAWCVDNSGFDRVFEWLAWLERCRLAEPTGGVMQQGVCHTIRGLVPDPNSASGYRLAHATGVTSPDYVMVPREPTKEMLSVSVSPVLRLGHEDNSRVHEWRRAIYMAMLSAAPPSPRSDEGSGLTPSKHGFSPALRAQVIEECAKVADQWAYVCTKEAAGEPDDPHGHEADANMAKTIARSIRSLSAVSAIAQERDVGKGCSPLPWEVDTIDNQTGDGTIKSYAIFDAKGRVIMDALNSSVIEINSEHDGEPEGYVRQWDEQSRKDAELIVAAVNAFTTSPSAISEAPTSAEAGDDK